MMTTTPSLYQRLGVASDATQEEIKQAYRRLARRLHPDVNPDPAAHEEFKLVAAAYDTLGDPAKRQEYDRWANFQRPSVWVNSNSTESPASRFEPTLTPEQAMRSALRYQEVRSRIHKLVEEAEQRNAYERELPPVWFRYLSASSFILSILLTLVGGVIMTIAMTLGGDPLFTVASNKEAFSVIHWVPAFAFAIVAALGIATSRFVLMYRWREKLAASKSFRQRFELHYHLWPQFTFIATLVWGVIIWHLLF